MLHERTPSGVRFVLWRRFSRGVEIHTAIKRLAHRHAAMSQ
jgi:hypothetical protein